jgi:hypothetical protein
MDITKLVVSLREKALLYGDYSTYWSQLSGKLLNCRKKLNIATKSRGKFNPKTPVTPEQIAENHEYVTAQLISLFACWLADTMPAQIRLPPGVDRRAGMGPRHVHESLPFGRYQGHDEQDPVAHCLEIG